MQDEMNLKEKEASSTSVTIRVKGYKKAIKKVRKIKKELKQLNKVMKENEDSRKKEKHQVAIDPDSYIGKEIIYQTALLHEIKDILNEIRNKGSMSHP